MNGNFIFRSVFNEINSWLELKRRARLYDYIFGSYVDQIIAANHTSEGAKWYLGDRLGAVVQIVNDSDTDAGTVQYQSFGTIIANTTDASWNRYFFSGRNCLTEQCHTTFEHVTMTVPMEDLFLKTRFDLMRETLIFFDSSPIRRPILLTHMELSNMGFLCGSQLLQQMPWVQLRRAQKSGWQ